MLTLKSKKFYFLLKFHGQHLSVEFSPVYSVPETSVDRGSTILCQHQLECVVSQFALAQKKHVPFLLSIY